MLKFPSILMRVVIWVFHICLYVMVSFGWCDFFAKAITQKETTNRKERYVNKDFPTHIMSITF